MAKPKILFFDVETTPLIVAKFQFDRNPFIDPNTIQKDWFMISACWKWAGQKTVHSVAITKPYDDYNVVKTLRDVLASADIIVGHCIDRFDVRILNARMIVHRIAPLPNLLTVDTKKMAAKVAAFTSNKLDYLAKTLLGVGKIKTDFTLWLRVLKGEKKAIKEMVAYNKVDVIRNEEVYYKLLPYMRNHPHVGVLNGHSKNHSCPNCGSTHLKRNGTRPTKAGVLKQEVQCLDCGSYQRIPITK